MKDEENRKAVDGEAVHEGNGVGADESPVPFVPHDAGRTSDAASEVDAEPEGDVTPGSEAAPEDGADLKDATTPEGDAALDDETAPEVGAGRKDGVAFEGDAVLDDATTPESGAAPEAEAKSENGPAPAPEAAFDAPESKQANEAGGPTASSSRASWASRIGKKKLAIGLASVAGLIGAAAVIVAVLLGTHIICFHEHISRATCTQPCVCLDCGRVQGDALGHDFKAATCAKPKTCTRCGYTEGSKLDHTPEEWKERVDIVSAERVNSQKCTVCGAQIDSQATPLDVLYSSGDFIFNSSEFAQRMDAMLEKVNSEFGGEYRAAAGDLDGKSACAVLDKRGKQIAGIMLLDDGSTAVYDANAETISGLVCTQSRPGDTDDFAYVVVALLMTVDPSLDVAEAADMALEVIDKAVVSDVHLANGVKYGMEKDGETVYVMIA
ncbi:MAG: hypothetical protein Q4B35_02115 [Slackia sp.]|nr:hypothetical protein [Slackia sp.]